MGQHDYEALRQEIRGLVEETIAPNAERTDGNGTGLEADIYSWIADLLSGSGWASIRYDKLGTGQTGLGPYTDDPDAMLPLSYDQLRIEPARQALR